MKISNSKKQLAKIIHENGGWRDSANWSVQHKRHYGGRVVFTSRADKPEFETQWHADGTFFGGFDSDKTLICWHQTILSRDEYFHLYPKHTETEYKDGVKPTGPAKAAGPSKPAIEQLAADYRNRKDYADRKQQEADVAKDDAEAKLAELVAAGRALGFVPVSAVRSALDGCMRLVDMVPTRLQSHQDESIAAIGYVVNVERLYDTVREAAGIIKGDDW